LVTPATPDLVMLAVGSKPYQWMTLHVENVPPSRSFHSAAMVGNFMIIAFGYITGTQGVTSSLNILDISNNTNFHWSSYNMNEEAQSNTDKTLTNLNQSFLSQNLAIILGGSIGGIVVLVVIIVVLVLLYKSWKSNSNMRGRQQLPSSQNS